MNESKEKFLRNCENRISEKKSHFHPFGNSSVKLEEINAKNYLCDSKGIIHDSTLRKEVIR